MTGGGVFCHLFPVMLWGQVMADGQVCSLAHCTSCLSPKGLEANTIRVAPMSEQAGSLSFEDLDRYYHPGHPYSGKVSGY